MEIYYDDVGTWICANIDMSTTRNSDNYTQYRSNNSKSYMTVVTNKTNKTARAYYKYEDVPFTPYCEKATQFEADTE